MGKNTSFTKNIAAVLNGKISADAAFENIKADHVASTILPDPPQEIIIDIPETKTEVILDHFATNNIPVITIDATTETADMNGLPMAAETTNPEKEIQMETTETPKIAAPTRANLVACINDLNSQLADCKIPTDKKYTVEVLTNMIKNKELEIVFSDITPTNEGDKVFSHETIETMVALGMTMPSAPAAPKAAAKDKKNKISDKFTRHDAVLQALDKMPADGQTFAELQKEIDDIMVAKGNRSIVSTSCSEVLKFSLLSLIHFGKMVKDETSKKYTFVTVTVENV